MDNLKYIIASSHVEAGLCNRLKCIISVIRLSKKLGMKPLIFWMPPNLMGSANFSDLFNTKIDVITESEFKEKIKNGEIKSCKLYEDCLEDKYHYFMFNDWRFVLLPGEVHKGFSKVFPENEGKVIDLEYKRIPLRIRKDFLLAIKQISPNPSIQERVNKFVKEHNGFNGVIGLQVRRRDFLLATDGRGKISSNDKFFNKMRAILKNKPKTKFFLSTDCSITQKRFIEQFPDKIFFFPRDNWDKSTKESTITGFIDVLLLSKTKHMLGSFLSSFVEIAWWFGKCKAKVEIIGDKNAKEKAIKILNAPYKNSLNSRTFRQIKQICVYLTLHYFVFRYLWNKYLDYRAKKLN